MTEKMTRLTLPGQKAFSGIKDWGEKTPQEMIAQARAYAAHLRAQAEAIEKSTDANFQVDLVRGQHVERHIRTLQSAT